MLELKDATLTVDDRLLFENLSFMAGDGQMTCITGLQGAGKTAMVEVMLGLLPLSRGLVSIDGELLTPLSAPTFRRLIAYVPQKREVSIEPTPLDLDGLETVWSPFRSRGYRLTAIDEHLDVEPLASKPIVIADDPEPSLLSVLKSLTMGGHTVIVASQRDEFLNMSDKIITLGKDDAVVD
jgi:ABC-type protease/lipase transport system fused ATPase/permease subunit